MNHDVRHVSYDSLHNSILSLGSDIPNGYEIVYFLSLRYNTAIFEFPTYSVQLEALKTLGKPDLHE